VTIFFVFLIEIGQTILGFVIKIQRFRVATKTKIKIYGAMQCLSKHLNGYGNPNFVNTTY